MARKRGDHLWELVMPNFQSNPDVLIESNGRWPCFGGMVTERSRWKSCSRQFFFFPRPQGDEHLIGGWKWHPRRLEWWWSMTFTYFSGRLKLNMCPQKDVYRLAQTPLRPGFPVVSCWIKSIVVFIKTSRGVIKTSPTCRGLILWWGYRTLRAVRRVINLHKLLVAAQIWSGVLLPVPCWCATAPMASCGSTRTSSMETRGGNDLAALSVP